MQMFMATRPTHVKNVELVTGVTPHQTSVGDARCTLRYLRRYHRTG